MSTRITPVGPAARDRRRPAAFFDARESGFDGLDRPGRPRGGCPFCGDPACRLGISGPYGGDR